MDEIYIIIKHWFETVDNICVERIEPVGFVNTKEEAKEMCEYLNKHTKTFDSCIGITYPFFTSRPMKRQIKTEHKSWRHYDRSGEISD